MTEETIENRENCAVPDDAIGSKKKNTAGEPTKPEVYSAGNGINPYALPVFASLTTTPKEIANNSPAEPSSALQASQEGIDSFMNEVFNKLLSGDSSNVS